MYSSLCFEQLGCQALGESKNCLTCSNRHMLSDSEWKHLKELFPESIVSYWEGSNEDNSYIFVSISKAAILPAERDKESELFMNQVKNMKLSHYKFYEDVILPEKGLTSISDSTSDSTNLFSDDNAKSETMALILLNDEEYIRVLSMPFNGSIPTLIKTLYDNNLTEICDLTIITDMRFKEVFTIQGNRYYYGPFIYVEDVNKN